MAKKNQNDELSKGKQLLKDMTQESGYLYDALTSIGENIKQSIDNAIESMDEADSIGQKIAKTYSRDIVNSIRQSARDMDKLVGIQIKLNKKENVSKQIQAAIEKNLATQQVLKEKLNGIGKNNVDISKKDQENLIKTLETQEALLKAKLDENTENMKSVSIWGILGKSLSKYANKLDQTGTLSGILKGNWKEVVTTQRLGQLASVNLIAGLIKGVIQLDKLQTQYNKSFGVTNAQAASIQDRMSDIAETSGRTSITFIDMHKAMAGIGEATGILATGLRDDVLEEAAELQKLLGVSNKGMAMLAFNAQVTGQNMEEQSKSILKGVYATEKRYGLQLDERKILQEVAEVSGLIRANFGRNVEHISKALSEAKALGLTLQDLASISSNLLNFQSSIEAELTAELFIGRQLNLEKARLYALTGDYSNLLKEIKGQLGSEYDFLTMNVLAKEKFAAALGMSVNQMSDLIFKEGDLAAIKDRATAAGDEDTLNMLKQRDLAERMADIMTKVQTTFVAIAEGPIGTLAAGIGTMLESATSLKWILGAVAVIKLGGLITSMYSLATAFGLAGAGAAWMTGLATAGIGLAIAVPIILGTMATMKKSQKEMKTVSFQDLPKGQIVASSGGEGRFHAGEFVGHMSDWSNLNDGINTLIGVTQTNMSDWSSLNDGMNTLIGVTQTNKPPKPLAKWEAATLYR